MKVNNFEKKVLDKFQELGVSKSTLIQFCKYARIAHCFGAIFGFFESTDAADAAIIKSKISRYSGQYDHELKELVSTTWSL